MYADTIKNAALNTGFVQKESEYAEWYNLYEGKDKIVPMEIGEVC